MGKHTKNMSPDVSVTTLLVSVEDLINMAMGPEDKNVVNFKLLQTVLHILARQMRLLEQKVEIRVAEYGAEKEKDEEGDEQPRGKSARLSKSPTKSEKAAAKEKEKELRAAEKERKNIEKSLGKEQVKEDKEREKAEKASLKEKERAERGAAKDRDREDRATSKEREKAEKAAAKERDKEERGASKEKERADKAAAKEREREERGSAKDREKAERAEAKDREREERATSKGREKAEKAAAKERDKEERRASKEREKADKASAKEKEKEERAAEKADRAASKEREKEEKASAKADKAASKDKEREEKDATKADKAASKEREREEKAAEKADRAASKDREKEEKAAAKADRAASKDREKDEKAAAKEDRASAKDREREGKGAAKEGKEKTKAEKEREKTERADEKSRGKPEKEMTTAEKAAAKEREKEEASKGKKGKGETGGAVKGKGRDKDKSLLAEKGSISSTSSRSTSGRANIEVVTRSQFDLLKDIVTDLADKAGPLPMPSMPKNKELLQRLSKGTASLTDMMGAMQVNARVGAAEQAITRMGGILTELAVAGALPEDIAGQIGEVTTVLEAELQEAEARAREQAEARGEGPAGEDGGRPSRARVSMSRKSMLSSKSRASTGAGLAARASMATSAASGASFPAAKVTHPELDNAIRTLKDDLTKNMGMLTAKSTATADGSMSMVKAVAEKLDTAVKLNDRISTLHSMVTDYAEQLSGFDTGLTTQMQSFSEQMVQMRGDLQSGLKLLESVNNNAETAAVMELTERYDGLVLELDHTLQAHSDLTLSQTHLGDDLKTLMEGVEMLREQKADRDEVLDGLRDKADISRLAGLLTEEEFAASRSELERRLAVCHDKFHRQDSVWLRAVNDLKEITETKADLVHLLGTREEVQRGLQILHDMCRHLALVLGEPKAAVLTRKLTRGATCGACMVPALMDPQDANAGAPARLPAARPQPAGAPAEEVCEAEFKLSAPPDTRQHICQRWVGGSHTLLSDAVTRLHAEPMTYSAVPTSRYTGYGTDGRLYMMEEELQPCLECNKLSDEADAGSSSKSPIRPSILVTIHYNDDHDLTEYPGSAPDEGTPQRLTDPTWN